MNLAEMYSQAMNDAILNQKPAPTAEAKLSAVQLRIELFRALEAAIDNRWTDVEEHCQTSRELAQHIKVQEG